MKARILNAQMQTCTFHLKLDAHGNVLERDDLLAASALPASAGPGRFAVPAALLALRSDDQLVALFRAGHDEAFRATSINVWGPKPPESFRGGFGAPAG